MSFAVSTLEHRTDALGFAIVLRDGLTLDTALRGTVSASIAGRGRAGTRKNGGGTFVFFDVPSGPSSVAVRSAHDSPYYRALDIGLTLPFGSARWPAYPDIGLADPALPLTDPSQPAAYRAQFLQSLLMPDIAYPFDPGTTLLRGTVLTAGTPVAGAVVTEVSGKALEFITGGDGEFVLPFITPPATVTAFTIRTQRVGRPDVDTVVTIRRGVTTSAQIDV